MMPVTERQRLDIKLLFMDIMFYLNTGIIFLLWSEDIGMARSVIIILY